MKKTKLFGTLAVAAMVVGLASCGGGEKDLVILVPSADHGWTGAILSNARDYANELKESGDYEYNFVVQTSGNSEEMNQQMEDLVARKDTVAGVVTLPWDASAKPGVEALANANIPFVVVDRVITDSTIIKASDYWVGDVRGNNEMIGELTAEYFIDHYDLTAGQDKILVIPGDNSSVPLARNDGFQTALKEAGWTQEQITAAWDQTPSTGWSRATASQNFISWLKAAYAEDNTLAGYRCVFTHDSECSMGILEALVNPDSGLTEEQKTAFGKAVKVIASSSGLQEMYDVIKGQHERQSEFNKYVANVDFFDVTYPPSMIKTGVDDMLAYLKDGTKIAGQDHVVPVDVVDKDNVDEFYDLGF